MTKPVNQLQYDRTPFREVLANNVPNTGSGNNDFFLYVMGPYTAFDIAYAQDISNSNSTNSGSGSTSPEYIDDPLFNPSKHTSSPNKGTYEAALNDICGRIRDEVGARAFLATNVGIPTPSQSKTPSGGMTPLRQSLYFAAVSDAVIFVFSHAALNAGVATEMGTILSEFNLRPETSSTEVKSRQRFRVFHTPYFNSATVSGVPMDFAVDQFDFSSEQQLVDRIDSFVYTIAHGSKQQYPLWDGPSQL